MVFGNTQVPSSKRTVIAKPMCPMSLCVKHGATDANGTAMIEESVLATQRHKGPHSVRHCEPTYLCVKHGATDANGTAMIEESVLATQRHIGPHSVRHCEATYPMSLCVEHGATGANGTAMIEESVLATQKQCYVGCSLLQACWRL